MGISVIKKTGQISPILTCDRCGERIEDISCAMAGIPDLYADGISPAYLFHKEDCDLGNEIFLGTEELPEFLRELFHSVHLDRVY